MKADSAFSTYIHGEWREGQSSERITTTSPSTGEVLGVTHASSPGQVDAAVASARAAFESAALAGLRSGRTRRGAESAG